MSLMRWPLACFSALALGAGCAAALATAAMAGCDDFVQKVRAEAGDTGVDITHAVVVSRNLAHTDIFDLSTHVGGVDGSLACLGDQLIRFEAHISEPASARARAAFERVQSIALEAALGWEAAKSRSMLKGMDADVTEYLAASHQRGEVIAGKTEEHVAGGVSLGMIATDADRTFLIIAPVR
jgi:hypothetical protein